MTDAKPVEQRFYIDCEFDGHGGPLLSFAIVREDGNGAHVWIMDAPPPLDPWVAENVIPIFDCHNGNQVDLPFLALGPFLRSFIGDCQHPVIIADSPIDIGRFCAAISTSADGGWASADYPLMTFEVHNVDCYPTDLPGAVQHNAWWDAMALRHKLADFERDLRPAGEMRAQVLNEAADYFDGYAGGHYMAQSCAAELREMARAALAAQPLDDNAAQGDG